MIKSLKLNCKYVTKFKKIEMKRRFGNEKGKRKSSYCGIDRGNYGGVRFICI